MTYVPLSDAKDLDAVVHALGIEDSDITPAEAVAGLHREIEHLRATLAERDAEVERLKGLVYAPGEMRCAKCKFVLLRRTMFVRSGTIGAGSNETEPCPNGCGPLWSRTWKDVAVETGERLEEMFADLQAARAALSDQPQHQGDGR
jgi:hypothetical protein